MTREEYEIRVKNSKDITEFQLTQINYISSLEQHIAELESPKTCDGCKYWEEWSSALGVMGVGDCLCDTTLETFSSETPKEFGCINYEPKDKK